MYKDAPSVSVTRSTRTHQKPPYHQSIQNQKQCRSRPSLWILSSNYQNLKAMILSSPSRTTIALKWFYSSHVEKKSAAKESLSYTSITCLEDSDSLRKSSAIATRDSQANSLLNFAKF